ncbi:TNF receptor-associated factor 6-like [Ornithodoros turicata]|uniref:TNF receptor-associated factor 6-like n=1 Tax=Ornithodoros turicata TaxID=34597 RepID=UPI003138B411
MATSERRLVGFCETMDWRFTNFVDLNPLMACSLCHIVPTVTFVLECSHVLCELCYQNLLQGKRRCPLDGEGFRETGTGKLILTPVQIGKQKARCYNFNEGCDFVGTVYEVKQHFFKECTFHAVTCTRCQVRVLRKEIVDHYVEQCVSRQSAIVCPPAGVSDAALEMGKKIDASLGIMTDRLSAIEEQLHSHAGAIRKALECEASNVDGSKKTVGEQEHLTNSDRFETVNERMRAMMDEIQELTNWVRVINNELSDLTSEDADTTVEESTEENNSKTDSSQEAEGGARYPQDPHGQDASGVRNGVKKVVDAIKRLHCVEKMLGELQLTNRLRNNVSYFHIQGVADIEKESMTGEAVVRTSNIFRLFGYSAKLKVVIESYRGTLYLGVFLRICKSSNDTCLKWPFTMPCTLVLVHPTDEKKNIEDHIDVLEYVDEDSESFIKPVEDSNVGFGSPELCRLQYVLKKGFVHNNSITVGVSIP